MATTTTTTTTMTTTMTTPLLEEKMQRRYYENCPGCRQDRKNAAHPGIPYRDFFYIWLVTLCSTLPIQSVFPFLYFMIRDLHIAKEEEDIGFYAGFVGSTYMFGRALTSVLWGVVADKYGRKPVIVISILSVIIVNSLFGLSSSYWMAITTRALLGLLCGILGPIKAYASEVSRKEHQALGLSLVGTSRCIGLIVGPAIGGFLAQPAEKYPNIFSQDSLFGRFPYFLPCLCISLFAVCALIACFWLPETLHMHHGDKLQDTSVETLEESLIDLDLKANGEIADEGGSVSKQSLLKNWPLMSAIIVYCVFSLQEMAYIEIFSLWAVSDRKYGGLNFSTEDVGEVLAITGVSLLVYQILLYPFVVKWLSPVRSIRLAAVLTIPLFVAFPFMSNLSGIVLKLVVNCASFVKNVFSVTIITGLNLVQNNAVCQEQRGAANGISVTAMSLFKAAAPAGGGALFSWAQKRTDASFLPGDHIVFFALNVIVVLGLLMTYKPFLAKPDAK
ncbi:putative peptide/nitrate transporter [Ananas comosus]|uniref:Putative peptide/nitrate transporter n=1 Tax=Ananas comosus TaxID=4615 RepID=A0A199VQC7_ANACO|nr:putative peptide/nitrate transporter [Ananas comosus]